MSRQRAICLTPKARNEPAEAITLPSLWNAIVAYSRLLRPEERRAREGPGVQGWSFAAQRVGRTPIRAGDEAVERQGHAHERLAHARTSSVARARFGVFWYPPASFRRPRSSRQKGARNQWKHWKGRKRSSPGEAAGSGSASSRRWSPGKRV